MVRSLTVLLAVVCEVGEPPVWEAEATIRRQLKPLHHRNFRAHSPIIVGHARCRVTWVATDGGLLLASVRARYPSS